MKKLLVLLFIICSFPQLMCSNINWSSPVLISTMNATASDPRVVIDMNGNVTAIWVENNYIKTSSQPANMSWSAPVTLSNAGASSPRLGIDPNGNVTAVWIEAGVVEAASLPLGGSWSAEVALSGSGTATSLALSVDTSGNAIAVWVQSGTSIQSATQLFGGSWPGTPDTISGSTSTPSSPSISIGANGTVVVVWHALSSSNDVIYSASKTISKGVWGTPLSFFQGTPAYSHNYPKVVVDANGNATAIWLRYIFSNSIYENITVLTSSLLANGNAWSVPAILTSGAETVTLSNISTRLAVDTNGNVIAIWCISYDGSIYNIETIVKPAGENWNPIIAVQLAALYAYQADVSANNSIGDALAVYMVFNGSSVLIQSLETNIAAQGLAIWSAPQTISQGANNGFPHVATSVNGEVVNAAAVWINFDGVSNTIVGSTGSKTTIQPPTNLAVVQSVNSFGVFTECCNTISWTPSTAPNIIKYDIYRNGIYFTSVNYFDYQVIDHNAIQNGSVTYSVAAEDLSRTLSPMAQVNFP